MDKNTIYSGLKSVKEFCNRYKMPLILAGTIAAYFVTDYLMCETAHNLTYPIKTSLGVAENPFDLINQLHILETL